jgi:hypothetical protein
MVGIPASFVCPCKTGYPLILCVLPQFLIGNVRVVPQITSWPKDSSLRGCYTVLCHLLFPAFWWTAVASSSGSHWNMFLLDYLTLMIKVIQFSEVSGTTHTMTQHNIPQDSPALQHHCDKFKSRTGHGHFHSHPFQFRICQPSYHLTIHNLSHFKCCSVHKN